MHRMLGSQMQVASEQPESLAITCCNTLAATNICFLLFAGCALRPSCFRSGASRRGAPASTLLGIPLVWWWPCIALMHAFIALHLL
jgi:hypothetical protein